MISKAKRQVLNCLKELSEEKLRSCLSKLLPSLKEEISHSVISPLEAKEISLIHALYVIAFGSESSIIRSFQEIINNIKFPVFIIYRAPKIEIENGSIFSSLQVLNFLFNLVLKNRVTSVVFEYPTLCRLNKEVINLYMQLSKEYQSSLLKNIPLNFAWDFKITHITNMIIRAILWSPSISNQEWCKYKSIILEILHRTPLYYQQVTPADLFSVTQFHSSTTSSIPEFLSFCLEHSDDDLVKTTLEVMIKLINFFKTFRGHDPHMMERRKAIKKTVNTVMERRNSAKILSEKLPEKVKGTLLDILHADTQPYLVVKDSSLRFKQLKKFLSFKYPALPSGLKEIPDKWLEELTPRQCLILFEKLMQTGDIIQVNHDLLHKKASLAVIADKRYGNETIWLLGKGKTLEEVIKSSIPKAKRITKQIDRLEISRQAKKWIQKHTFISIEKKKILSVLKAIVEENWGEINRIRANSPIIVYALLKVLHNTRSL